MAQEASSSLDPAAQEALKLQTFQVLTQAPRSFTLCHGLIESLRGNSMSKNSLVVFRKNSSLNPKKRPVVRPHSTLCDCMRLNHFIARVAFDPKPFIRTFEAAVDKLIALRKDVQSKTEQMEKSVRVAEREYSKKMADLNRGFEVRCHIKNGIYHPILMGRRLRPLGHRSAEWRLK